MAGKRNDPIGVFDSGLGGLTVVKEIMHELPSEHIVYFGDTARVPYGTKSKESIIEFSRDNARILMKHKVKMIVVACNSSSSYALNRLKREFPVPVIGVIHAGAQRAVGLTKTGKVGVIATSATVASNRYEHWVKRFDRRVRVYSKACPLFVPIVEEGWSDKPLAVTAARDYLTELKTKGIDVLILGCTHYPLIKNTVRKVMGPNVALVDSAKEVAREVKAKLQASGRQRTGKAKPQYRFLISDRPQGFQAIAKRFLGRDIKVVSVK